MKDMTTVKTAADVEVKITEALKRESRRDALSEVRAALVINHILIEIGFFINGNAQSLPFQGVGTRHREAVRAIMKVIQEYKKSIGEGEVK